MYSLQFTRKGCRLAEMTYQFGTSRTECRVESVPEFKAIAFRTETQHHRAHRSASNFACLGVCSASVARTRAFTHLDAHTCLPYRFSCVAR